MALALLPFAGRQKAAADEDVSGSSGSSAAAPEQSTFNGDFYSQWPYRGPMDVVPYVKSRSRPGEAAEVLKAIDDFSTAYPMYKIGPEKGKILEDTVKQRAPKQVLELGTFIGYSAIRISRNLGAGAHLTCIEANPDCVTAARQLLHWAGLADGVDVLQGLSTELLPKVGTGRCVRLDIPS